MKRKLIAAGLVLAAGLAATVVLLNRSTEESFGPRVARENWQKSAEWSANSITEILLTFNEQEMPTYAALMQGIKSGRINLAWELWRLRRRCPEHWNRYECNSRILAFLREVYPGDSGRALAGLVQKYLVFEEVMSETPKPARLTPREQYEIVREKRRTVFSRDEALLVFGLEEARMDLRDDTIKLLNDTKGQSGDARVRALEDLRRRRLGQYYEAFVEDEPSFDRYELEMTLREDDLRSLPESQKAARTTAVRERYFGKDGAARMAAVEKDLRNESRQREAYEAAERAFLAENAALSASEKEVALMRLRREHFGPELAAAYTRRRTYENSLKAKQM